MRSHYARAGAEPTLDEVLEDPIVRLVMRRDGVARRDVRQLVEHVRERRDERFRAANQR